ncbi:MAG: ferrous iron transporter B, partial [Deltaproteobacteria bacterium]|nr:ferrous iron transporter B [Deltaproteobacteria bacterium]
SLGMVMMLGIYVLSTLLALIAVAVLGHTLLKGQPSALLLELPPYRLPTLRGIATILGQRAKVFVKTAGTVILASTIVIWALLTFPQHTEHDAYVGRIAQAQKAQRPILATQLTREDRQKQLSHSFAGRLGKTIEPLIAPLGFDWKIGVGLIGAFSAREVFVSTMGLIYGAGSADEKSPTLRAKIRAERRADGHPLYSPLVGVSLIVFFMIAMQCLPTLAVVRQESASWRWPIFQLVYLSLLAYAASLTVYQVGRALVFA